MTLLDTITTDDVLSWDPCVEYDRERLDRLCPITPLDLTDLRRVPEVSAEDRLWVLLRPEILSERELRLFACDCAERTLRRERRAGREPDERSWQAVEVARRYAACGEVSAEDLSAAMDAAREAAWDAAWDANMDAAGAAAWAAWAAAMAAAMYAGWAATMGAAMDAGWAATMDAAWAAAKAAAMDAARDAGWGAAGDAAGAAAKSAERRWQLKRVRHYFRQREAP